MTLQERIQQDLSNAMRSKDESRLSLLRMMKTAVKNREIDKRQPLDDAEVQQVLSMLIKQRRDAADQFRKGGREDMAAKEEADIPVLESYLPAGAGEAEIDAAVDAAVAETGATSAKQMGAVMKAVMAKLGGKRVDGKIVSDKVRARLG